jgi:hypothetical protein
MQLTRPINESEKRNFDTLIAAMQADRVCLVSTFDHQDQQPAILICAVNYSSEAYEPNELVPLARLCDGNPYDRFSPPSYESSSQTDGSNRHEESS